MTDEKTGPDPYDAVAAEHVISPGQLRDLLDEWDAHPGRWNSDEALAALTRNYEFLQRTYDAMVADRDAHWARLPADAGEERGMKAIFQDKDVLRAAVAAAVPADHPVLQLERKGDRLRIVGSDTFVLVSGEVDAFFNGWDEGSKVKLDGSRGALKGLGRALKLAADGVCEVVVSDGSAAVYVRSAFGVWKAVFACGGSRLAEMERVDPTCELDPQGGSLLAAGKVKRVSTLMGILGPSACGWRVEPHGKNKLACFRMDERHDAGRNVHIMAMTLAEG